MKPPSRPKRADTGARGARPPQREPARARPDLQDPNEEELPPLPPKKREALSNVGGPVRLEGSNAELGRVLQLALAVTSAREDVLAHVHGFHSYPAKLHPVTARELIAGLSRPGALVLDPFCGSGTVLVEARLLGRPALGVDANPLAIELANLKAGVSAGFNAQDAAALAAAAAAVSEHAETRRLAKAGPTHRYGPKDRDAFDTHVLLELDGLRNGIDELELGDAHRRALLLVLSSLLTKVSRKAGDTSEEHVPRRLAGGYVIRLFEKKARELGERLAAFAAILPPRAPEPRAGVGDARHLDAVKASSVDLVVSSPPYAGVYDYHEHHVTRLRWLGLDDRTFELREVGSRRKLSPLPFARALGAWERELSAFLAELARVLAPRGLAALVIADSVLGERPVWAKDLIDRLAPRVGLVRVASASQERPHFHRGSARAFEDRAREEHVIVLGRS
jgi:SAM-dependent methyltransferase